MRFPVRISASLVAVVALALCSAQTYAQTPSSSSSSSSSTAGPTQTPAAANNPYIAIDPLALVRYDNRFDVSLGLAYDHMKAGPTLLQGSNLGGLDLEGSYWLTKHWGVEGSTRYYLGTSGAAPNNVSIKGPFVSENFFVGGAEWLGPHNKHGALIAHAMFGGVYGDFEKDLRGNSPSVVDFYNNQIAPAGIIGGHMDLNRSARWVFRITPDAVITRYGINYGPKTTATDVNFALSVGIEYKFKKKR